MRLMMVLQTEVVKGVVESVFCEVRCDEARRIVEVYHKSWPSILHDNIDLKSTQLDFSSASTESTVISRLGKV